jgi:hypothetical protein
MAECHTDRKHCAKGLCKQCYNAKKHADNGSYRNEYQRNKWGEMSYDERRDHCKRLNDAARNRQQLILDGVMNGELRNATRHGVSTEWYIEQYRKGCAICGTHDWGKKGPCIDHDHKCCHGRFGCEKCVRGVLCQKCNKALGDVNDSQEVLLKCVSYLQSFSGEANHGTNILRRLGR